jgi:hypothetical protein
MTSIAFAVAIGVGAAIVAAASPAFSMIAPPSVIPQFNIQRESVTRANVYPQSSRRLAQDSDDNTDSGVPPDQVEKYVAVYKDMQRDRSLTVDTAAAKEGLSVAEFRELEQKIERDDAAREHVRNELQGAVEEKP